MSALAPRFRVSPFALRLEAVPVFAFAAPVVVCANQFLLFDACRAHELTDARLSVCLGLVSVLRFDPSVAI